MTIDIYSKGQYPADVLSNFYANSFVIDGVECASMEGFLQSLKYRGKKRQRAVCAMVGIEAKNAGAKKFLWKLIGVVYWQGKRYKRDSKEFDELRLRAYEAMLYNRVFRQALVDTNGAILTHSIGRDDKRKTILTTAEFIGYLDTLRQRL